MKLLAQNDPELKDFTEIIQPYASDLDAQKIPYWVIFHEKSVAGIVIVGHEPLMLIEPVGTKASIIYPIDSNFPADILKEFVSLALKVAQKQEVVYSFIDISSQQDTLIDQFLKAGYAELANSLRMSRSLDALLDVDSDTLRYERVKREDVDNCLEIMKKFMGGSPDVMLNIILSNIQKVPEQFLDYWFNSTQLFYAYHEDDLVGFLDISPKQGLNINNLGVSSAHRGKGYGRQMMRHAMRYLKEQGVAEAKLRVHVDNMRAIQLYESLGFTKGIAKRALIWRK
ncbi:MAG: GNAT family N-acetyltransferase [Candidatus Thorarchaeota archaeon]|nr:GNAT family N-acetyltransferase [Candidatus Thorarchaeota archaeon]